MKIIKTTDKPACKAMVGVGAPRGASRFKKMERITDFLGENKKRAIVIACSMLMIGSAVFLNLKLFAQDDVSAPETTVPESTEAQNVDGVPETELNDTYFALAVIERQRARDEAIEVLQSVVDAPDASDEDKNDALETISQIAEDIRCEANIESLLKAAGFESCIAIIEKGKANVIVSTNETLMANEIARITEIVYNQSGIGPQDLVIKEH